METLNGSPTANTKEEQPQLEERNLAEPKGFEYRQPKKDISRELQKIKLPEFSGGRAGERVEAWLEGMNICFALCYALNLQDDTRIQNM